MNKNDVDGMKERGRSYNQVCVLVENFSIIIIFPTRRKIDGNAKYSITSVDCSLSWE